MRFQQSVAQLGDAGFVLLVNQQLIWICSAVMSHRHRFSTPDQLRAAETKMSPASKRSFARFSLERAIPPFHRMNAKAVADFSVVVIYRLCQRSMWACLQFVVAGNP